MGSASYGPARAVLHPAGGPGHRTQGPLARKVAVGSPARSGAMRVVGQAVADQRTTWHMGRAVLKAWTPASVSFVCVAWTSVSFVIPLRCSSPASEIGVRVK